MKIETHLNYGDFNTIADYLQGLSKNEGESSYDQRLAKRYGLLFARIAENDSVVLVIEEEGDEVTMRIEGYGT